jgi:2-polyprenyl-3-methyl-5-hydroxy-6-metoxy-1,4-benzoquinol methylase
VPYADFDADFVEGQGDANRVQFVDALAGWFAAVSDIDARLRAKPAARVADVACATGWSSLAIARAYPLVHVDGFDLDEESIRLAQVHLEESGLGEGVRFSVRDARELASAGSGDGARYDVVTVFEAVHDLARPVEVLRRCAVCWPRAVAS